MIHPQGDSSKWHADHLGVKIENTHFMPVRNTAPLPGARVHCGGFWSAYSTSLVFWDSINPCSLGTSWPLDDTTVDALHGFQKSLQRAVMWFQFSCLNSFGFGLAVLWFIQHHSYNSIPLWLCLTKKHSPKPKPSLLSLLAVFSSQSRGPDPASRSTSWRMRFSCRQ